MSETQPLLKEQEQEFKAIQELIDAREHLDYCMEHQETGDESTWDYWWTEGQVARERLLDAERHLTWLYNQ